MRAKSREILIFITAILLIILICFGIIMMLSQPQEETPSDIRWWAMNLNDNDFMTFCEHTTPETATITQLTIYSPDLDSATVDTFDPDGAKTLGTYVQEGNSYKWTITYTQFEQLITFCNGETVFLNTRAIAEDFATRAGRSLIDLTISKK